MAADSQPPKPESQRLLDRVSELIASLHQVQNARLGSQPPTHLSDISGPSPEESDLGNFHGSWSLVRGFTCPGTEIVLHYIEII